MAEHESLEAELAEFKGVEAVLTFQSGFTANTGVIRPSPVSRTSSSPTRSTMPRSSTGCACPRRPQGLPHRDVEALREILREAAQNGRPTAPGRIA